MILFSRSILPFIQWGTVHVLCQMDNAPKKVSERETYELIYSFGNFHVSVSSALGEAKVSYTKNMVVRNTCEI